MSSPADNMIADLAEREFIVFAGAGMSKATGIPTWKKTLIRLNELAPVEGLEIESVDSVQYPNVAQMIYTELQAQGREEEYHQAIESTLQPSECSCHIGQLKIIRACPSIITTNLDPTFEAALKDECESFEKYTGIKKEFGFQTLSNMELGNLGRKNYITYLHGRYNEKEKVFKITDYSKYYTALEGGKESIIEEALKNIYIGFKAIVFVGFSFEDKYVRGSFDRIFQKMKEDKQLRVGQIKHYAIVEYAVRGDEQRRQQLLNSATTFNEGSVDFREVEELKKSIKIEEQLRNINVEVIRYQHGNHLEVEKMFEQIAKKQRTSNTVAKPELGEEYEYIL
jgi:hypothetical protein